jgi:P27 family predicted phage terminase small subunit
MEETSLVQFKLPKNVKHKEAKKLICNLVRDMNERGELAPFDVALLHRMATSYEMYLICVDKITTDGMTMINKKGEMVKRPEVNILKENWSQFLELAKEFGLTAMSKRKLKTMKNIDEAIQSPLKEYLREHQV